MNKNFVFVTLCHDYADEFNVECCFVDTRENYEATLESIQKKFDSGILEGWEFYFGTNEYLSFHYFDDLMTGVEAVECSKEFYEEFNKLCGGQVGFNVLEHMREVEDDSYDDFNDEDDEYQEL